MKMLVVNFYVLYNQRILKLNLSRSCLFFLNSHMGLKQGDPSSPLMFINDIVDNINIDLENIFTVHVDQIRFFMLLYADDAVVFAKSSES